VNLMIEVCVDTIWQGKVAIRQQYVEEARLLSQDILVCHKRDKMRIKFTELAADIVGLSPHKVIDKFRKKPPGYLYYFKWEPNIVQGVLIK